MPDRAPRILSLVHDDHAGSGVFAEVARRRGAALDELRPDHGASLDDAGEADALIVLGGNQHATEDDRFGWLGPEIAFIERWVGSGRPLLGVCLGAQLLCRAMGGVVRPARQGEFGWYDVTLDVAGDPVLGHLPSTLTTLQWHSYESLPAAGAVALGHSDMCLQAFRIGEQAWGVQFHPETTRADLETWISDYGDSPAPREAGFAPDAALAATETHIETWNEVGRSIVDRFIDRVAPAQPSGAPSTGDAPLASTRHDRG